MKENMYVTLLKHRSFMAFWCSTTLLRLASNLLQFALAIYVLDRTGSAFIFSTVLSVILIPRLLCTSIAGYAADFQDSIRILRWGILALAVLMACFFIIHLFLPLNVPLICMLVICLELCETFLSPSEGKALLTIVSEDALAPATKLSSLDDGIVETLSPVIAAFFYGRLGLTGILGLTLVMESFAFVMAAMIRSHSGRTSIPDKRSPFSPRSTFHAYRESFLCLKAHPHIIGIILFAPLFNFFVSPLFSVTVPHYFRVTMLADVELYAVFNTVLGIAGLITPFFAMLCIGDQDEARANKVGTILSAVVLGCLTAILQVGSNRLSANGKLYTVIGAMALLVSMITMMNIATSITIKKQIPEQILGRVISIIQLFATISVPLGQLFYGLCSDHFPFTVSLLLSFVGLWITFSVMAATYKQIRSK